MKTNYLLLALLLLSFTTAIAQTEKGRWTAGASIGSFRYTTQDRYDQLSGSLSPSVGYFVGRNFLIGAGVPLSFSTAKTGDQYKDNSSSAGLSPYIRYFIGEGRLKPYAGVSYGYSRNWRRYSVPGVDAKATGQSSTVVPTLGVAYFINQTVALNAGLSYVIENYRNENIRYSPTVPVEPESRGEYKYLALGVGFQIFFGK